MQLGCCRWPIDGEGSVIEMQVRYSFIDLRQKELSVLKDKEKDVKNENWIHKCCLIRFDYNKRNVYSTLYHEEDVQFISILCCKKSIYNLQITWTMNSFCHVDGGCDEGGEVGSLPCWTF